MPDLNCSDAIPPGSFCLVERSVGAIHEFFERDWTRRCLNHTRANRVRDPPRACGDGRLAGNRAETLGDLRGLTDAGSRKQDAKLLATVASRYVERAQALVEHAAKTL